MDGGQAPKRDDDGGDVGGGGPFASPGGIGRAACGAAVLLRAFRGDEPARLGAEFAAIEPWRRYPVTGHGLARFLAAEAPGVHAFAIEAGGGVVGALVLQPQWLRGPYLQFLGLVPAWQGKGIGRLALEWLECEGRAASARHVWIMVSDFNDAARAFYARQGYREMAPVADVVADGFVEILLSKRL